VLQSSENVYEVQPLAVPPGGDALQAMLGDTAIHPIFRARELTG
jgi:hypothetical protein